MSLGKEEKEFAKVIAGYAAEEDVATARILSKISSAILKYRLERGMNQKEFAEVMGVSQSMISKWESGDCNFTISTVAMICAKMSLTFDVCLNKRIEDYYDGKDSYEIKRKNRHMQLADGSRQALAS